VIESSEVADEIEPIALVVALSILNFPRFTL
jgi:hypothetical protein